MKKLIITKHIVTADDTNRILRNSAVEVENNIISNIYSADEIDLDKYEGDIFNFDKLTLLPGFVQTHVHLCQTLFRGLADDLELLDWLSKKIFPFENAHNENSLRYSAKLGIHELQTSGTTTILDMGTINNQHAVFEEMANSGMRGFSGKCLIDRNSLHPAFKEDTERSLVSAVELAKEFHDSYNKRIKYAFAPRFVLSCSEKMLVESFFMMKNFEGSLYHTHSSENKGEIEEVRKLTGMENIEYFNSLNVLSEKTILAHCIHVNENEKSILKDKNVRVAHCPNTNLKLGSGTAPIPEYIDRGIQVSIGSDGPPCNNTLSIFDEMKTAALKQKPLYGSTVMDALTVFRLATIEGAKALHLENEIGSIEVGKKADLVLMDLSGSNKSLLDNDENVYSNIVYASDKSDVNEVMIDGDWVVRNRISRTYSEDEIVSKGKEELIKLLKRTEG